MQVTNSSLQRQTDPYESHDGHSYLKPDDLKTQYQDQSTISGGGCDQSMFSNLPFKPLFNELPEEQTDQRVRHETPVKFAEPLKK
jgi:hypothetical protein